MIPKVFLLRLVTDWAKTRYLTTGVADIKTTLHQWCDEANLGATVTGEVLEAARRGLPDDWQKTWESLPR